MSECPFCSDPRIRESAQGNRFRCGTVGPDINGEYSTGHVCDIAMYNRLLAERNSEIERLDAENDRLLESIRDCNFSSKMPLCGTVRPDGSILFRGVLLDDLDED